MAAKRYIVLLLVLSSLLVGCATPAPAAPQTVSQGTMVPASVPTTKPLALPADVTPKMVEELRSTGAITIIDVREPSEYAEGRIPGSTLIPLVPLQSNPGTKSKDFRPELEPLEPIQG